MKKSTAIHCHRANNASGCQMSGRSRREKSTSYFPILKWRHKELAALSYLDQIDADYITPVFELPPEQWDFDIGRPSEDLRAKYARFGIHLSAAWKNRRCAIDSPYLSASPSTGGGHILNLVFEQARSWGCVAFPVFGLHCDEAYLHAVKRVQILDGHGACLRLQIEDVDETVFMRMQRTLQAVAAQPSNCDLLIDFGANAPLSASCHVTSVSALLASVPFLDDWRNVIVARTSIPAALPHDLYWPRGDVDRYEWSGYLSAASAPSQNGIDISYSDYGVVHPSSEMVDPRLIGRDLSLVYARDDHWSVYAPRGAGAYEIESIARACCSDGIADQTLVDTRSSCWADAQIQRLAVGQDAELAHAIWPQLATNRHLSVVARQLANQRFTGTDFINRCTTSDR